ncbi:hypothetical protein SpCBS45565_g03311 [Spizellomyces sp. 'palustris']|nr:hypothetical protein SpCBS45565_g03311 [Spizellomyces sp. 'palustris']
MKAIQVRNTGDSSVLQYVDVDKPTVSADRLLIKNSFVGVNFIDTYHRSGLYKVELPFILGREASGVVEAVGEGVTGFAQGDRVAYLSASTYAQYTATPPTNVVRLPPEVTLEEGAALLIQGLTALTLAQQAYEVKPGDHVLVHAAAGGTGQMLVQVCKHLGARVIGTTSSEEKAATVRRAGADDVILYTKQDVVQEVHKLTNGQGVAAVFDGVGRSTFDESLACLKRLGFMLSFGNASGKVDSIDIMKLVPRAIRLMRPSLFEFLTTKEDFDALAKQLMNLVAAGKVKINPPIIYPLEDAAKAHDDLEGRKTQGKLLLQIP